MPIASVRATLVGDDTHVNAREDDMIGNNARTAATAVLGLAFVSAQVAELDTNLLGVPQEPYGFSRDATGGMGPPDFNDAAFAVDGDATRITIQLN